MENAAEALQMAAAVLIFVLALSIAINSFGEARQTAQIILDYNDREYETSYLDANRDSHNKLITERIVGLETIVPSIYKAYRENYKIVFKGIEGYFPDGLYKTKDKDTGLWVERYLIDLQSNSSGVTIGTDEQKLTFIMAILYGSKMENFGGPTGVQATFRVNPVIWLNNEGIYDIIKDNNLKFKENIGIYYQEEAGQSGTATTPGGAVDSSVPESNLTKKRVITYTLT